MNYKEPIPSKGFIIFALIGLILAMWPNFTGMPTIQRIAFTILSVLLGCIVLYAGYLLFVWLPGYRKHKALTFFVPSHSAPLRRIYMLEKSMNAAIPRYQLSQENTLRINRRKYSLDTYLSARQEFLLSYVQEKPIEFQQYAREMVRHCINPNIHPYLPDIYLHEAIICADILDIPIPDDAQETSAQATSSPPESPTEPSSHATPFAIDAALQSTSVPSATSTVKKAFLYKTVCIVLVIALMSISTVFILSLSHNVSAEKERQVSYEYDLAQVNEALQIIDGLMKDPPTSFDIAALQNAYDQAKNPFKWGFDKYDYYPSRSSNNFDEYLRSVEDAKTKNLELEHTRYSEVHSEYIQFHARIKRILNTDVKANTEIVEQLKAIRASLELIKDQLTQKIDSR